ncbi:MAG: patatin family protein [Ruminococcus sp.]|nr:patatin family protein [Ruminococcus sp.]
MLGIVDVGGGMRCIYSGGVYDCFLDKNIKADYCLGVSAGSANLMSYACAQRGRNLEFYENYALRKEYMSVETFIKTGSYLGLDYIFSSLCNDDGEYPLDYEAFCRSGINYKAAATRASDGKAVFFTNDAVCKNNYDILKASCCLPVVCKPYEIGGIKYYDGGIAEPIPVKKAFEDGCDKVVLVLSKPREDYTTPFGKERLLRFFLRTTPEIASLMGNIHERCAEILEFVAECEKNGSVLVLEPKDCFGMKTLTRDKAVIRKMYDSGYADAMNAIENSGFFGEING